MKNYRIGFDIGGLVLFLIIMIPNFIWFAVPAPNDILRSESVTSTLDMIASICQVIMIAALCLIINNTCERRIHKPFLFGIAAACLIYFMGWIFYYNGIANPLVILALCIAPCLAFLLYTIMRKNIIAMIPAVVFMGCHIAYGVINFMI